MVNKFIRGKAFSILLTGGLIVGGILIARRLNLGGTIAEGAFGVGQAAGQVITQPIAGLTNTLTSGIDQIAAEARGLFESLGSAGADVQGGFTGNRNAIGTAIFGTPEIPSNDLPSRGTGIISTPTGATKGQFLPSFQPNTIFTEGTSFKSVSTTGKANIIPTTSSLEKAGATIVSRPTTLTQVATGTQTRFALPPALEGLRSLFE